jgi:hypothetical protein
LQRIVLEPAVAEKLCLGEGIADGGAPDDLQFESAEPLRPA